MVYHGTTVRLYMSTYTSVAPRPKNHEASASVRAKSTRLPLIRRIRATTNRPRLVQADYAPGISFKE